MLMYKNHYVLHFISLLSGEYVGIIRDYIKKPTNEKQTLTHCY